jgi:hypothetical protein
MAEKNDHPKLPGMPGPSSEVRAKRQAIDKAFELIHAALLDTLDGFPGGGKTQLSITKKLKGDVLRVTITPGNQG